MRKHALIIACTLALAGCGGGQDARNDQTTGNSQRVKLPDGFEGEVDGVPARQSKFARLQIGMPAKQVTDLIGQPTDTDMNVTGKVFIPFYFGGDTVQMKAFYRGEGFLIYTGSHFAGSPNRLAEIHVNPAESGYAH
jgi:hypothetical protein